MDSPPNKKSTYPLRNAGTGRQGSLYVPFLLKGSLFRVDIRPFEVQNVIQLDDSVPVVPATKQHLPIITIRNTFKPWFKLCIWALATNTWNLMFGSCWEHFPPSYYNSSLYDCIHIPCKVRYELHSLQKLSVSPSYCQYLTDPNLSKTYIRENTYITIITKLSTINSNKCWVKCVFYIGLTRVFMDTAA